MSALTLSPRPLFPGLQQRRGIVPGLRRRLGSRHRLRRARGHLPGAPSVSRAGDWHLWATFTMGRSCWSRRGRTRGSPALRQRPDGATGPPRARGGPTIGTKIVDRVVGRLAQQTDVSLRVSLTVKAEQNGPDGRADDTVRTISEGAQTSASEIPAGTRSSHGRSPQASDGTAAMSRRSLLGNLWFYAPGPGAETVAAQADPSTTAPADEEAAGEELDPLAEDATAKPLSPRRNRALENYTTEALAGAVREKPEPLLRVLAERGICGPRLPIVVSVETQQPVPNHPFRHLDLVVRLRAPDGRVSEVWLEVKVHAPVSGNQLKVYSDAASAEFLRDGVRRELVWLGPSDPPEKQKRHLRSWIHWQSLADAAIRIRAGWFWEDLVSFLRENGMTEDRTYPISAREATVLEDARRLFLKSHAALAAVNDWAPKAIAEWPADHWYTSGAVKTELFRKLLASGELLLKDGSSHPVYLRYGFASQRGEACLVVRVEMRSAADEPLRSQVLAEFGPALEGWDRPGSGRVVLEVVERAVLFERQEDAVKWFEVHLTQLQKIGFYAFACGAGGAEKYASHRKSGAVL